AGAGAMEQVDQVREWRWRFEDLSLDEPPDLGAEGHVLRIRRRVLPAEPREFLLVPFRIVPQEEGVAVRERQEELRVERMGLVPESRELEVPDDLGSQEARGISEPRELDAGEDLFRDGGAANDRAAFYDEDTPSRFGEVRRSDETVVASADDDGIPRAIHGTASAGFVGSISGAKSGAA